MKVLLPFGARSRSALPSRTKIFRIPPTEDRRRMSYLAWKILRRLPKPVVLVLFLFLLLGARA